MTDTTTSAPAAATSSPAPYFPAPAPAVFADAATVRAWCARTFADLGAVADRAASGDLAAPTPCSAYTLGDLLDHVLGWCDFFGHAVADAAGARTRPDPADFRLASAGRDPAEIVTAAAQRIDEALAAGVLEGRVRLSQAEMDGPAALAMIVGEYLVHGWDLARASAQQWAPDERACAAAHDFFAGIITPDYRGPEGFFGEPVPVGADAGALECLLGFAGRDPAWRP